MRTMRTQSAQFHQARAYLSDCIQLSDYHPVMVKRRAKI
jgi:hypothetical protein